MAYARLSLLAMVWFVVSAPIVVVDALYVLYRAPSSSSSRLPHPLAHRAPFSFWSTYARYDRRYAPNDDAFVVAQSYVNFVEVTLGLIAVACACGGAHERALKVALVSSVMTIAKTVLYFVMDVVEGGRYTKHNTARERLLMVQLPSSIWLLVPGIIAAQCLSRLTVATVANTRAGASSSSSSSSSSRRGRAAKRNKTA